MSGNEAKGEIFLLAFRAMPKKERQTIVRELLSDRLFRDDLDDIAIFEARRDEKARPIEGYLAGILE